jgi:hypothetical protein
MVQSVQLSDMNYVMHLMKMVVPTMHAAINMNGGQAGMTANIAEGQGALCLSMKVENIVE